MEIFSTPISVYNNRESVICHLPQEKILYAPIGLLSSFYIFNVSYHQWKAMLTFLEQALLEIGHRQTLATVSSIFNDLANAWVVLGESLYLIISKVALWGHVFSHSLEEYCCKTLCFSDAQIKQYLYSCAGTRPFVSFVLFW